jgi:hypothetical protein
MINDSVPVTIEIAVSRNCVASNYMIRLDPVKAEVYSEKISAFMGNVISMMLKSTEGMLTPPASEPCKDEM